MCWSNSVLSKQGYLDFSICQASQGRTQSSGFFSPSGKLPKGIDRISQSQSQNEFSLLRVDGLSADDSTRQHNRKQNRQWKSIMQ